MKSGDLGSEMIHAEALVAPAFGREIVIRSRGSLFFPEKPAERHQAEVG